MTIYQSKPTQVDAHQVPESKNAQGTLVTMLNYRGGEAYLHDSERVTGDYTVPSHISLRANPFATGFEKAYPGDWIIIRVTGHFEIWSDEEFTKFFEAV
jgi:hypothetical protein